MSASTHAFVRMMRKADVFAKIKPELLSDDTSDDTPEVFITCRDPNRFPDNWEHFRTLGGTCRSCIPFPAWGGALVIPEHSPLAVTRTGARRDTVFLDDLDMALEELGTKKIRPSVHYPCLAVEISGLTDLQVIELNVAAKDRLRQRYPGIDIALFVHIDWCGYAEARRREMETFKFDRRAFQLWKQSDTGQIYLQAA